MLPQHIKIQIESIWDIYIKSDKVIHDLKGNVINNIDKERLRAIEEIKIIIGSFLQDEITIYEFKSSIDSYNKRNNFWGFTATKGQMFFNHLTKVSEPNIENFVSLLKQVITEPHNLENALSKIDLLEKYADSFFVNAKDKRKAPNPRSTGYFLSYFWQLYNPEKWPIIYTSLVKSFAELGIWKDYPSQKEEYRFFFDLYEEIKAILKQYTGKNITNWDAEHAFWNYSGNPNVNHGKRNILQEVVSTDTELEVINEVSISATFAINDYLIPRVAKLVELGKETEKSAAAKGYQFEKLVTEVFQLLDFEVISKGQGSGREPDAIIKFREEDTAFIVDAKAYSNGYTLGTDDRAIKEYVNRHIPKLRSEAYKKVGFIIVSNSFKSNFDSFINDITWNTDIKRFILIESEALLYLLAYKTRDRLSLSSIIESLISFGNIVKTKDVIEKYGDI